MIPDINKRRTDAIAIWEFMIRYGLKFGKVFATSNNFEGFSIWYSSKYLKKTFWRQLYCKPIKVIRKLGLDFVKRANIKLDGKKPYKYFSPHINPISQSP